MATRLQARVVRPPSLPLTEQDEQDLALMRHSPAYQQALAQLSGKAIDDAGISEAALLHAVFEAGLSSVRAAAEEAGYALVAADQGQQADDRDQARRRRPSWANEA